MRFLTAVLASAAMLGALAVAPAFAQYPPPGEPITITPSNATPAVGQTITLQIQVNQQQAAAIGNQGGGVILASAMKPGAATGPQAQAGLQVVACTAGVTGGAGATVTPTSFNTDAQGRAELSLYTGTQPGTLTVGVTCGSNSAQILVQVGAATPTVTATAPGVEVTGTPPGGGATPQAPNTGTG
ncbi:MAG: hypothetical protein ACM3S1_14725, partial [Hyphomicrobiales bacterium]